MCWRNFIALIYFKLCCCFFCVVVGFFWGGGGGGLVCTYWGNVPSGVFLCFFYSLVKCIPYSMIPSLHSVLWILLVVWLFWY